MPKEIRPEEVRRMVAEGAQLVEVLPSPEYDKDKLDSAPITTSDGRLVGLLLQKDVAATMDQAGGSRIVILTSMLPRTALE